MKNYVVGFLFSLDKKNIVLIKKKGKSEINYLNGKINGIGGKIEKKEASKDAMIREFKEETGVYFDNWNYLGLIITPKSNIHFYYGFSDDAFNAKTNEDKGEVVGLYEMCGYLFDNYPLMENLKFMIPLALNNEITKPLGPFYSS